MLLTTRVPLVAPPMCELFERLVPLKDHWYLNGVWPVALTVKAALLPASKLWLCGCWVMAGADCAEAPAGRMALIRQRTGIRRCRPELGPHRLFARLGLTLPRSCTG